MVQLDLEKILTQAKKLSEIAEKEGLWFYNDNKELWLSPKKFRNLQKKGNFLVDIGNWTLRDPLERLKELEERKFLLEKEIRELKIEMLKS